MFDRLIAVELVQHADPGATGVLLDSDGGLAVLSNGVGLRVVLPAEEARMLARCLDSLAGRREAAEAMMAEAGVVGHA